MTRAPSPAPAAKRAASPAPAAKAKAGRPPKNAEKNVAKASEVAPKAAEDDVVDLTENAKTSGFARFSLAWFLLVAWRLFFYGCCTAFVAIRIVELGIIHDEYPFTLLCVVATIPLVHLSVPVGGSVALQAATLAGLVLGTGFVFDELALARPFHARHDAGKRFEGKTVYVTGANSGIGYETARWAAAWGRADKVWLACRSMPKCQAALEEIEAEMPESRRGGKVLECTYFDLMPNPPSSAYEKIDEFASAHAGKVDVLINNAGAGGFHPRLLDLHDVNSPKALMMSAMHSYLRDALKPKRTVSVSSAIVYASPYGTLALRAVEQILGKVRSLLGASGPPEAVGIYDLTTAQLDVPYSKLQHTVRIPLPSTGTDFATWYNGYHRRSVGIFLHDDVGPINSTIGMFLQEDVGLKPMTEMKPAGYLWRLGQHAKTRHKPVYDADGKTLRAETEQGEPEALQIPKDWETYEDYFVYHPGYGDSIYARKLFAGWRSADAGGELYLGKVTNIGPLRCQIVSESNGTSYDNGVYCGINYAAESDYMRAKLWQVLDLDEESEVAATVGFVKTNIAPFMSWNIFDLFIRPGRIGTLQVVHSALTDELTPEPRNTSDLKDTPRRCMDSFNVLQKCLTRWSWGGDWLAASLEKFGIQETYDYSTQKKIVAASIRAWNERYSNRGTQKAKAAKANDSSDGEAASKKSSKKKSKSAPKKKSKPE